MALLTKRGSRERRTAGKDKDKSVKRHWICGETSGDKSPARITPSRTFLGNIGLHFWAQSGFFWAHFGRKLGWICADLREFEILISLPATNRLFAIDLK